MAYVFDGCFSRYVPGLEDAMRTRWPVASVRRIDEPFDGVGLRMPWEIDTEELDEIVHRFREELPEWSRAYPDLTFAHVVAECFGGECDYAGYVVRDGQKLLEESLHPGSLGRLMAAIGVALPQGDYFEPFTRSFAW